LATVSVTVEAYVDQKNPFNHADLRGLLMIEWGIFYSLLI